LLIRDALHNRDEDQRGGGAAGVGFKFWARFVAVSRRDCRGNAGDTKSEQGTRELPLGSVSEALRAHVAGKAPTDRVFLWRDAPIVDNQLLGKVITPIMEGLGIKFPGFGWHTFRRLHLRLMSKRGLTLFELRQQAGHADVRTTQRYIVDERSGRMRRPRAAAAGGCKDQAVASLKRGHPARRG
jgi:hypothetical protein